MKILLTGSQGYVGSVLGNFLLKHGYHVVGLDTGYFRECYLGDPCEVRYPELVKDVRDIQPGDLKGFDAVIHLAALSNDPLGALSPRSTMEIGHSASVRLAHLAKICGVQRFVFASSCSLYGATQKEWVTERDTFNPVTVYGEAKACAERDISTLADSQFCPTFLRIATAFGVSPRLRFDVALNNLVGWAYTTGKVRLLSDGLAWRPIVHVEDMCRAYVEVLEAPKEIICNQSYNVGANRENYQIRTLAEIVQRVVPGITVEYATEANRDARSYRVSFDKINAKLPSYRPEWTAERGARQLYTFFRQIGLTYEQFQSRLYTRLSQIQYLLEQRLLDSELRWTECGVERGWADNSNKRDHVARKG